MSAALDFRKCKRLLLSSLAVSPVVGGLNPSYIMHKTKRTSKKCLSVLLGGGRGIRSCLLQSNLGQQFLCFAKAFGQPLKTTRRVVFLTLSFESLLLSSEKTKRTSKKCLSVLLGGGRGIRTPVGFHPNGFQDRLVMTASIFLHVVCQARIIRTVVKTLYF